MEVVVLKAVQDDTPLHTHYASPRIILSAASPFAAVVKFSHPFSVIRRSSSILTPPTGINRASTDLLMYFECTGEGRKTVSSASRLK